MKTKMILEARINEYAMRDENPHVPWTADEIAESAARCREAGALIVHFHARKAEGSPLRGIDALRRDHPQDPVQVRRAHPPDSRLVSNDGDPAARIESITTIGQDPVTKPDMVPVDTGSTNLDTYDPETRTFGHADRVYISRTDTLQHYARELRYSGVKPVVVSWG
jgi:3-keto-5-aminohexanoate cleavage enzyme